MRNATWEMTSLMEQWIGDIREAVEEGLRQDIGHYSPQRERWYRSVLESLDDATQAIQMDDPALGLDRLIDAAILFGKAEMIE